MNLLSLDASTKATGWAVFKDGQLASSGVISASSTDVIKRIQKITSELDTIISENEIDVLILEEVLPSTGHNINTNVWKALTYLQASIAFLLHDKYPRVKVEYIMPNSWRAKLGIHTGRGVKRETLKSADIRYVEERYGIKCGDDQADAICIGTSHYLKSAVPADHNWV